jgi:cardiolipin synthase
MPVLVALPSANLPFVVTVVLVLADFIVKVVALGFIPENRRPSSATAWLLAVFLIPFVGILAFLLIGSPYVDRGRRRIQAEVDEHVRHRLADMDIAPVPEDLPGWLSSAVTLNQHHGTFPYRPGNDVTFYDDYGASISAMTAEVARAEHYVHVEFYIMGIDDVTEPFFAACKEAVARGVTVRVLFDHLGSRAVDGYKDMLAHFDAAGFIWHAMLPIQPLKGRWQRPDLRNHRKILVVDGRVAVIGSQNLIEPGYKSPKNHREGRTYRELTARIEGPVVTTLNAVFATDWFVETHESLESEPYPFVDRGGDDDGVRASCQVVPSGPGFPNENNLRLFNTLIYGARCRVSITSPYFVPDESLLYAITTAAQRGVDVELFVSEQGDQFMVWHAQKSYYDALLRAGVRIYLYPGPYILHSKFFSVDDDAAVLGSSNMDMRSFGLNFEISVMGFGGNFVRDVQAVEDTYRAMSRELTLDEWSRRPLRARYVDNVMRLTSALQ